MTDSSKPWESENGPGTPPANDALDALKKEAGELGIEYAPNIGATTLSERIKEHKKNNPTPVETPQPPALENINAQKADEKVSKQDRKATKASIDWDNQAPLEIINMVSQGMSIADAKAKHAEALTIRAQREAVRRGADATGDT